VEYEIEGVQAISSQDVIGAVKKQLYVLLQSIFSLGVALWLVTLVLIGIVFSMIVNERQREMGLLRSLGAKRRNIFAIITIESVFLSLIGGVLGIVAGGSVLLLLKHPIQAAFNLPSLWPDPIFIALAAATALVMALMSGVVAVFYPAYKCSRMEPYATIRKGE
jgi:putative ABC transport system permease protein